MIDEFDHNDFRGDERDPKPVTKGDILGALLMLINRPELIEKELKRRDSKC